MIAIIKFCLFACVSLLLVWVGVYLTGAKPTVHTPESRTVTVESSSNAYNIQNNGDTCVISVGPNNSVTVSGSGNVKINGVTVETGNSKHIEINVMGDAQTVSNTAGAIKIQGNVFGDVHNTSGDITCNDIKGSATTISGDIHCKSVEGNVKTISGDIN